MFILCCTRKVVSDSGEKDSKFGGEKALGVRDCAPGVLGALRLVTFEVLTCFWWEKVCLHVGLMLSPCVSSPIVQPSGRVCRGSSAPPPQHSHTLLLPTFFSASLPHCVFGSRACMDNQSAIMAQRLDQSGQPLLDFKVSALPPRVMLSLWPLLSSHQPEFAAHL